MAWQSRIRCICRIRLPLGPLRPRILRICHICCPLLLLLGPLRPCRWWNPSL